MQSSASRSCGFFARARFSKYEGLLPPPSARPARYKNSNHIVSDLSSDLDV